MSHCARCGAEFFCGMADQAGDAAQPCWCTTLPVMAPEMLTALRAGGAADRCFCPACLTAASLAATAKSNNQ